MKKILLSLGAAFLLAAGAHAQVSYGVKAGVNLPKLVAKASGNGVNASVETSAATSFYVSGYANIFAAPNFVIQPGLSVQGKGGKMEIEEGENATTNIISLDIPVNAVYYIPTGNTGSIFVGAGPYAGFHLSGKEKFMGESEDISFGSGEDEMKRVDFGLNFQLGYKLANGFLINGGYGLGLANLMNVESVAGVNTKLHNRVLSFGVGFEF